MVAASRMAVDLGAENVRVFEKGKDLGGKFSEELEIGKIDGRKGDSCSLILKRSHCFYFLDWKGTWYWNRYVSECRSKLLVPSLFLSVTDTTSAFQTLTDQRRLRRS